MTNEQRNGDAPASPINFLPGPSVWHREGLTKRELFAAMAMQGWLAGCGNAYSEFTNPGHLSKKVADSCVGLADALLSALQRSEQP